MIDVKHIKPLHDEVLIAPVEEEKQTSSGLFIPETASKEKPQMGNVLAVGPGKKGEDGKIQPMSVKVGDTVLYGRYSGEDIKIGGVEYKIVPETSIRAIVENK